MKKQKQFLIGYIWLLKLNLKLIQALKKIKNNSENEGDNIL